MENGMETSKERAMQTVSQRCSCFNQGMRILHISIALKNKRTLLKYPQKVLRLLAGNFLSKLLGFIVLQHRFRVKHSTQLFK